MTHELGRYLDIEILKLCQPCVYYLMDQDTVVYVGQSVNGIGRVAGHYWEREKKFDGVYVRLVDKNDLNEEEALAIIKYKPKYNKQISYVPRGYCTVYDAKRKLGKSLNAVWVEQALRSMEPIQVCQSQLLKEDSLKRRIAAYKRLFEPVGPEGATLP